MRLRLTRIVASHQPYMRSCSSRGVVGQRRPLQTGGDRRVPCAYTGLMFAACLPFGPCLTSKLTFCASWSDLNPSALTSEK
jgi:hypothetical protein